MEPAARQGEGPWGTPAPHWWPWGVVGVPNSSPTLQTLSLQRQMMENLVIAKAREETVSFPVGSLQEPPPCPGCHQPHTGLWGPRWGMEEGEGHLVNTVLALDP